MFPEQEFRDYLKRQLEKVALRKVEQLRASLSRNDNIYTSRLYRSIRYKVVVTKNDFFIEFSWLDGRARIDYGTLLNEGSSNMGPLDPAGQKRMIAWAKAKLPLRGKLAKMKSRNAAYRKLVYIISRNWKSRRRWPRRRGWASVAFGSRAIAELRVLTSEALQSVVNRYIKYRENRIRRDIERINRRR